MNGGILQVDGSIALSTTTVNDGGTLAGSGSLADVIVAAGGMLSPGSTLAPGTSAGELETGSVEFAVGATFAVELGGLTEGTGYDRLSVNGTVDLGAPLSISR